MTIIISNTDTIDVVLGGAPTTNQLPCIPSWGDSTGSMGGVPVATNGTTPVVVVPAPASGVTRLLNSLSIPNIDTSAATVTVNRVTTGGTYEMAKVALPVGSQLFYENGKGWYVLDANGNFLELVQAKQSGTWSVNINLPLPAGTNTIGNVGLNAGANVIGGVTQSGTWAVNTAPFELSASNNITSVPTTFAASSGFTKLRLLKIDIYGFTDASGIELFIKDGAGNQLYAITFPVISSPLSSMNFFFSDALNNAMDNAIGGCTAILSANPTTGNIYVQIGFSN